MDSKHKDFWEEFINLYRQHSCLCKDYANKIKRNSSYEELLKKYKEICPNATLDMLKKKINNIRTIFRRELKKVQDSTGTGTRTDDVYEPSLWYYDMLLFTAHCETARKGRVIDDSDEEENSQDNNNVANEDEEETTDHAVQSPTSLLSPASSSYSVGPPSVGLEGSNESSNNTPSTSRPPSRPSQSRKRSKINDAEEKKVSLLNLAHTALLSDDDEYTVVWKRITFQLKDLGDNQKIIAEKLISDVMYYAKLGKLSEDSRVEPFTRNPTAQQPTIGSNIHLLQPIRRQAHVTQLPTHTVAPTHQISSQPCFQTHDNALPSSNDVPFSLSEYITFGSIDPN